MNGHTHMISTCCRDAVAVAGVLTDKWWECERCGRPCDAVAPEPDPIEPTGIEAEVCRDIAERQANGIAKYGTTVADNPLCLRQWLQHAYEETLDKAVYLKRAIAEMEGKHD